MSPEEDSRSMGEPLEKDSFNMTEERLEQLVESQRRHRRRERWVRRWELNPFFWFLDEFPSREMYRPFTGDRRNTRQEMAYHRLRQVTSWSYWSHMKSTTGLKFAAAGGLISAFFQAAPSLKSTQMASEPLGWLLVAGFLYVVAVLWFEFRCPALIKRALKKDTGYLGIEGRRWLLALVEDEFRRWWTVVPYYPRHYEINNDFGEDRTLVAIMNGYGVPAYRGFDVIACAHIESALYEYVKVTGMAMWRESDFPKQFENFQPRYTIPAGRKPLMHRLHISRMSFLELDEIEGAKENDFVLRWFKSSVDIQHTLPKPKDVDMKWEAEGISLFFEKDDSALAFTRIIASWQNTMRPLSRLTLMLLFLASAGSFCCFVYLQMRFMVPALIGFF